MIESALPSNVDGMECDNRGLLLFTMDGECTVYGSQGVKKTSSPTLKHELKLNRDKFRCQGEVECLGGGRVET